MALDPQRLQALADEAAVSQDEHGEIELIGLGDLTWKEIRRACRARRRFLRAKARRTRTCHRRIEV